MFIYILKENSRVLHYIHQNKFVSFSKLDTSKNTNIELSKISCENHLTSFFLNTLGSKIFLNTFQKIKILCKIILQIDNQIKRNKY